MILYTATWCSKCKMIKPFVADHVTIQLVDDWDNDAAAAVGLKGIPTLQTDDGVLHPIISIDDLEKYGAKKCNTLTQQQQSC